MCRSRRAQERFLASAFAFAVGYTDVITLLRWKSFATIMTGNALLLGRAVLARDPKVTYQAHFYVIVICSFLFGAFAYNYVETKMPHRGGSLVGAVFAVLMISGELVCLAHPGPEPYSPYLLVFLTPMFGMLTVACPRLGAPTTMVTGHLANLGTVLAKCWFRHMNQELKDKAIMSAMVVMSILVGAGTGGWLVIRHRRHEETEGLLLPVAPCLALLLFFTDHLHKPQALVRKIRRRKHSHHAPVRKMSNGNLSSSDTTDAERSSPTLSQNSATLEMSAVRSAGDGEPGPASGAVTAGAAEGAAGAACSGSSCAMAPPTEI